jgi:hypothetical protein
MGLSFTIAAEPRQVSHSCVPVPQDSWPYFTVSDSRLPQPGGQSPRIYIPHEQGGPVIPPGTGFPFRHLLLAGLWCDYSNPPPKPKLCYDRRSVGQSFLVSTSIWDLRSDFFFCLTRGRVCLLQCAIYLNVTCYYMSICTQYIQGFWQSRLSTAYHALSLVASAYEF